MLNNIVETLPNNIFETMLNNIFETMLNNIVETLLNNVVETLLNNIVGPTMLLTHDNNVVRALFRQRTHFASLRPPLKNILKKHQPVIPLLR